MASECNFIRISQVAAKWNYFIEHAFPLRPGAPISVAQKLNKVKIDEKDVAKATSATPGSPFLGGGEELKARHRPNSPSNASASPHLAADSFGPPVLSLDPEKEVFRTSEKLKEKTSQRSTSSAAMSGAAAPQAGVSVVQLFKRLAADQLFMQVLCGSRPAFSAHKDTMTGLHWVWLSS